MHYVSLSSTSPASPYTSWETAATRIQDAVDAASLPGALVWVSDGVYDTGARDVKGMSNRLAVTKPVIVQSLNGPTATTIAGYQVPGTITGTSTVRCVYLASGAILNGFTITRGATRAEGDLFEHRSGGGLRCESRQAFVVNCVVTDNAASYGGGGSAGGTLSNCVVSANMAGSGGGAWYANLVHCALAGNFGSYGGGAYYSTGINSIFYHNTVSILFTSANWYGGSQSYCCAIPQPIGPGNFSNNPLFVNTNGWANLRVQSNSPCINAGHNADAPEATDLDGLPRVAGGTVDVGPYEFQYPASALSYAWLQQHSLPTDGSADPQDPDQDGHNTTQEWLAGTNPTNAASALRLSIQKTGPGSVALSWSGVPERLYSLERTASLQPPAWTTLGHTNWPWQAGTMIWTEASGVGADAKGYRLRAEPGGSY